MRGRVQLGGRHLGVLGDELHHRLGEHLLERRLGVAGRRDRDVGRLAPHPLGPLDRELGAGDRLLDRCSQPAPDLDVAFKDGADREAARSFMDLLAAAERDQGP